MHTVAVMPAKYEREERWVRFGAFLESLRRDLAYGRREKITQTDIANRAGMTFKQYSRIANGESGTRFETVGRLAEALELEPDDSRYGELYAHAGFVPPPLSEPGRTRPSTTELPELPEETREQELIELMNDDRLSPDAKDRLKARIRLEVQLELEAEERERRRRGQSS